MYKIRYNPLIIFGIISIILVVFFFNGLDSSEFIFSGDQFFRFNLNEAYTDSFFLRKPVDLGVLNGWQFITQFWDALFYLFIYSVGINFVLAEKILFFLVLLLSLYFSFQGLNKIALHFGLPFNTITVYLITIWYCFNPYTLELWHGGAYNLGSGMTYSLSPLIFYYFNESIFSETKKDKLMITAIITAVSSFTFWLLAPLLFFLIIYTLLRIIFRPHLITYIIKNGTIFLLFYIPMVFFIIYGIQYEYFNNSGDNNSGFSPTYGNMQGGIWYQLNLLFSWGIYVIWNPRSLYPFADYFFSKPYKMGITAFYGLIGYGILIYLLIPGGRYNRNKAIKFRLKILKVINYWKIASQRYIRSPAISQYTAVFLLIFALSVFFAKGAQPPFGEIFVYMYKNVPFFNVFRTPDIRFGFVIVLSLSILLLISSRMYKKEFFNVMIVVITGVLSWPFFSGSAVRGENINKLYYDRIIHIPDSYKNIATVINKNNSKSGYVMPIPAIEYGHYLIDGNEHLIGQDMLPKLSSAPFVYLSPSGGMAKNTFEILKKILETKKIEKLRDFPIRYILFRKDICPECMILSKNLFSRVSDIVYEDNIFTLYEMRIYRSIIDSPGVIFERINPVKFKVRFQNIKSIQELSLLQNFKENWKVFLSSNEPNFQCQNSSQNDFSKTLECNHGMKAMEWADWSYLWKPALFESSHKEKWNYANSWEISIDEIKRKYPKSDYIENADGSMNFTLTIYYQPQIWYILYGIISFTMTAGLLGFLFIKRRPRIVISS